MYRTNVKLICCWVTAGLIVVAFVMGTIYTNQLRHNSSKYIYPFAIVSCVVLTGFFVWIVVEIWAWTCCPECGNFGLGYDREYKREQEGRANLMKRMKKHIKALEVQIKAMEEEKAHLLKPAPSAPHQGEV